MHPQIGPRLDLRDAVERQRIDHVDFAREQGGGAAGGIGDRREDHLGQIVLGLVPPIGIDLELGAHIGFAPLEAERAGAVGVGRGEALLVAREIGRLHRVVLLGPALGHDVPDREIPRQDRIGSIGDDLDRVVVELAHLLDRGEIPRDQRTRSLGALEAEDDVIGGERGAIVEAHVAPQLEAPQLGRDLPPGCRERRLEFERAAAADQRLVDIREKRMRRGDVARVGIHRSRIGIGGPAQTIGERGIARREQEHQEQERHESRPREKRHLSLPHPSGRP